MKSLPTIHVAEFAGLETSYRIPLHRARNYWEFLEHIHNTFEKPWELYNAHLHLDNDSCDSRVSPSEWDAGAYFASEFSTGGRLNLYAHFEEVGTEARVELTEAQIPTGEQWHWNWHGDGGSKDKLRADGYHCSFNADQVQCYYLQESQGDAVEESTHDPYPPFPERLSLADPIYTAQVHDPKPSIVVAPPPLSQPPLTQSGEFVVVDETTNRDLLENGIVIGHARPQYCRDPRARSAARAILTQKGNLVAYISAKHSNSERIGVCDVMIPLKDIDYVARFDAAPFGEERRQAILDALPKSTCLKLEKDTSNEKDATGRIVSEGVVIGHAKPYCSHDPSSPPVVRAVLNSVGSATAFIEARESKQGRMNGMAQINLRDVDFVDRLKGVSVSKRGKAIRAMVLEAKGQESQAGGEKGKMWKEKAEEQFEID